MTLGKKNLIFCTLLSSSAEQDTTPPFAAQVLLNPTAKKSMQKIGQASFYYWSGTGIREEPLLNIKTGESELGSKTKKILIF